jgi:hypothetical protein
MRRRIRLTGRRQLDRTSASVRVADAAGRRLVTCTISDPREFSGFPSDSRLVVKLVENKLVELVQFGTLESPRVTAELRNPLFVAPSCQLRVVASDGQRRGLLLGSTDTWTLRGNTYGGAEKGILLFLPAPIAPRVWKLDIRENDYPIVYLDERIPNASIWAKTDPTFTGAVLPAVIEQIFSDILEKDDEPDMPWMRDWLQWADLLVPGQKPPYGQSAQDTENWIDGLIETFCRRHHVADRLIRALVGEESVQ